MTDSYSTQKGKGTLFGIQRVEQHIRECSEGYTRDCYVMKLDISGYFMSIEKNRLFRCVCMFLEGRYPSRDMPMLRYMLQKTIFNRPEKNCIRKVPRYRWRGLPRNKTLFGTDGSYGLPIGNLTSQLMALLFLDELDHLITEEWGVPHFGRYVDDMVLVHPSLKYLLEVRGYICGWLERRGLRLHPKKMYLQHYSKGVLFVGGMIKPGRKYISHRTQGRLFARINHYNLLMADSSLLTSAQVEEMVATMNSYLGMMCHFDTQRLFCRVLGRVSPAWYRYVIFSRRGPRYKLALRKAA